VEAIWRFSGLVTKVRHNDVRLIAPLTFKLFDLSGVSIDLFAAYAKRADALRKGGKKSAREKLLSLSDFLGTWLDHSNPAHSLMWDLIRHESAIMELQTSIASESVRRNCDLPDVSLSSIPVQRLPVIHHEMSCNVIELARVVRAGTNKLPLLCREPHYFAYHHGRDGAQIDVVEVDAIGSVIVDLSDGHRTIGEIRSVLQRGGLLLQSEDLCHAVGQLITTGLLTVGGS
jgi:hypothetical protein